METPEQFKMKLRKGLALVAASVVAVGLAAAIFWPRPDSNGLKHAGERAALSEAEAANSVKLGTNERLQPHATTQGAAPAPTASAPATPGAAGLDEPAPPITLTLTTSEAKASELRQARRRAEFEKNLKAKLSPEEWAIHEQGRKIWEASNARSKPSATSASR